MKTTLTTSPDRTDAKTAIEKGHKAYIGAMRANNAQALADLLASDAVFYPPNEAPVVGKKAIHAWYQRIVDQLTTTGITIRGRGVIITGNRAFEEGAFVWHLTPTAGGKRIEERGRFLAIWHQQGDGTWRVSRNIWNSSAPLR